MDCEDQFLNDEENVSKIIEKQIEDFGLEDLNLSIILHLERNRVGQKTKHKIYTYLTININIKTTEISLGLGIGGPILIKNYTTLFGAIRIKSLMTNLKVFLVQL